MQFITFGRFQKNERDLYLFPSLEKSQSVQRRIRAIVSNPLTFVILVWAMMFFFASLYFVYAQEAGKFASGNPPTSHKTRPAAKSKPAAKKQSASARKTEIVEVFSVGLETVGADFSRKASAGTDQPEE